MGYTAVMQHIAYLGKIEVAVQQQFFYLFNFMLNDILLNCNTGGFGKDSR